MTDKELLDYYEKYQDYQAGVINHTLNLKDLIRMTYLLTQKEIPKLCPHKCPVCNGMGRYHVHHEVGDTVDNKIIVKAVIHFIICDSCEGKGIVWGGL